MKLEWTRSARVDRLDIHSHIEADNPRAAANLDQRFQDLAARLASFPYLGRPGRVLGTREAVAHSNYMLVYEIEGDVVRILRVLHVARRWP
ncbi:type II toxin-antitoxin system RelE/ParE family toxin [Mycobacterium sp. KBS0706]|uniref:type II toxin-antitoxin system RelE/ParE family toxin n=1 Tax=Mycobacterium sp. KBS0706 TaxID=2578109 RepID=UPI00110FC70B|nr:type II toxin-antitoxin system RelE/ParE family toxin [Mycobacterium sp. KBS0706]TSD83218.1 type II toxin-antitoxin system RelE/ParE family toxin [Mycobacterium sp. KBS0706]